MTCTPNPAPARLHPSAPLTFPVPATTADTTTSPTATPAAAIDVDALRARFPALQQQVNGHPLAYLDNAATTQKPDAVLDTLAHYYRHDNANVHRGVHALAERATAAFESSRQRIARFLNAPSPDTCVFVRGATEALNLVAHSYGRSVLGPGRRVLITHMEHHSNIVPWQLVCEQTGASLDVVDVTDDGELDMDDFRAKLTTDTAIVAAVWVSNSLGTINPVQQIIDAAHDAGAVAVLDACQAAAHLAIDVQALGCDFLAMSAHKMFGPTGIGTLYGRRELLEQMPPWQGGGEMISSVSFETGTTYAAPPHRFEAGTPNIADAIAFGTAVDFMGELDLPAVQAHEADLLAYGTALLADVEGLRLIGTAPPERKAPVLAFVIDGIHPYDLAPVLDQQGVAIRTGHHCTQPLMERYGVPATARASMAAYSTRAELDQLRAGIEKAKMFFG